MTLISETFSRAGDENRSVLISYVMGGDPDPVSFIEYARAVASVSDIVEVGIPFSDPIADGPTIQAASVRALGSHTRVGTVFEACSEISKRAPVAVMCYYNTIHRMGEKMFVSQMLAAGVSGVIVPDLPYEEGTALRRECHSGGIDSILLASPATGNVRAAKIARYTSGFLYVISRYGVTGEQSSLSGQVIPMISKYRKISDKPIAIGFGISSPDQVKTIASAGADGVVVGSAIVSRIGKGEKASDISDFVASLKKGTVRS
ncbi:MAG: tryptophan synthase subunit alpha [Candidatus Thermoplasmatota archaeon]|jgi:tryptophan synthase alpha chain|nr:tryptophan synthase subunit alpha [Candidatus Sysuiplasma jiujiangense]MBX8638816.1 tryptophan synthase subunit alpha [Candidatus Sysuiplasma jiujiangense]MBX8641100.1 tryptophan synthase subunit alpha [Candidatus Sysuiplasma jiujiangense]MCL4317940.1 tryptophan synthase subunit alpha [Candidatus Thermoplasmatota archaeon]MCL5253194.1 tryptophan synthase subunit alpha [Candidatus Thermoplasmatota archaeon]